MTDVPAPATKTRRPFGFRFVMPLVLGSMLNPINSTMISTAMVPIALAFDATVAETGWLIAGLYLVSSVAQPTMGRMADLFGARRVYLVSLCLVGVAGLIGGVAPTLGLLVVTRLIIGLGTSGAYPSAMRIFRTQADRYGCEPPRLAMSFLSLGGITSAAIGPVLGGVLTEFYGWHSIFTVNVPLSILGVVLVLLWVPADPPRTAHASSSGSLIQAMIDIDILGILLFAAFQLTTMLFMMNLDHPPWIAVPVAAVFGVAMLVHSLRRTDPFIDFRMLARNLPLTVTYVRQGLMMVINYSVVYGFAQWLESSAHYSAASAGLMTLPLSALAAISALAAARTKGIRMPFIISTGACLTGCIGLYFVDGSTMPLIIAGIVMLFGLPQGLAATGTQTAIYLQAPAESIGTAAGLQRTATYIGAITATSLLGLVYGHHATDLGFHNLVLALGGLSLLLFVGTIFDRTLPRGRI